MKIEIEIDVLQDVVEKLLYADEKYRDSDKMLCARIWTTQSGGLDKIKKLSAYDFLCEYVKPDSIYYSQESIGRARRKLQEENPHLRGKFYREKQNKTKDVQQVLGYNVE
jgi:hypothetical protein